MPTIEELSCTLRELAPQIAKHGTFNFLLSNGQALWTHATTKLHYVLRAHPFHQVHLKDEDVTVNLAQLNSPEDRLAIVVTEPLTTDEDWVAMLPGQLMVFVDGLPLECSCPSHRSRSVNEMQHCVARHHSKAASSASINIAATSNPV